MEPAAPACVVFVYGDWKYKSRRRIEVAILAPVESRMSQHDSDPTHYQRDEAQRVNPMRYLNGPRMGHPDGPTAPGLLL